MKTRERAPDTGDPSCFRSGQCGCLAVPRRGVRVSAGLNANLELWQRNGEGPRVVRVGRGVRYRLSDVREFIEAGAATGTKSA